MSKRRIAATVLSTALTGSAFFAVTPGADAAEPVERAAKGCVTKKEYKKAKKGMPINKVHKIFGTKGVKSERYDLPGGGYVIGRGYKACTKGGAVGIAYEVKKKGATPRLAEKVASW